MVGLELAFHWGTMSLQPPPAVPHLQGNPVVKTSMANNQSRIAQTPECPQRSRENPCIKGWPARIDAH